MKIGVSVLGRRLLPVVAVAAACGMSLGWVPQASAVRSAGNFSRTAPPRRQRWPGLVLADGAALRVDTLTDPIGLGERHRV